MQLREGLPRRRLDHRRRRRRTSTGSAPRCAASPTSSARLPATTRCGGSSGSITVHPLGGAPMGRHAGEGVVRRRTARCSATRACTSLDGSAMPGPGRRQPVADHRRLRRPGERTSMTDGPPPAPCAGSPTTSTPRRPTQTGAADRRSGRATDATDLAFTEEMKGFVTLGATDSDAGAEQGTPTDSVLHVPPHDHGRRRRPLRRRPAAPRLGHGLGRVRRARWPAAGAERGWLQPVRRRRATRPGAGCSTGCTSPTPAATR